MDLAESPLQPRDICPASVSATEVLANRGCFHWPMELQDKDFVQFVGGVVGVKDV
ncbi:predicted protein [Plenodomus lingam JN3]|uniref:Predicted protein n=1 Tax=Leptosphaeria maculans (strain JN3 / isolate v23.1.3 / race Av1-4-5-6-7-8) TaxID=985895 RepID=E4ZSK6_LEPMJ|nr:predicted protein [Plenodomus lingam JN3]CBX94386.1 predicted protein [Plenodomus lingam JN3]